MCGSIVAGTSIAPFCVGIPCGKGFFRNPRPHKIICNV
nr:MAG TPA: hypothetical protein [Caudoviricetes sp.]